MKKLLTTASVIAVLASSAAYATEGNYVGLNLLRSQASLKQTKPTRNATTLGAPAFGAGVSYKYAFNMDGAFVAPGLFVNYINAENGSASSNKDKVKFNYGVRADIGYDVNDKVAPYFVVGFGRVNQKYANKTYNNNALLLGVGVKVAVAENMDLNFEYNSQKSSLKVKGSTTKNDSKLQTVQLGVSYKF